MYDIGGCMMLLAGDVRDGHASVMTTMQRFMHEFFPVDTRNMQCVYFVPSPETNRDLLLSHSFTISATDFLFSPHYCPRPSGVKTLMLVIFVVNRQTNHVLSVRFALSRWIFKRRQLEFLCAIPPFFERALHIDAKHIEGQIGFV
jgi:hypothetical protein